MDEYGNLQEWVTRTGGAQGGGGVAGGIGAGGGGGGGGSGGLGARNRRVVYGSTELVNAEDFLKELTRLGLED